MDADSHVEEPDETWAYLGPEYERRRPFQIVGDDLPVLKSMNAWYVDGNVFPQSAGRGVTIYGTGSERQKGTRCRGGEPATTCASAGSISPPSRRSSTCRACWSSWARSG